MARILLCSIGLPRCLILDGVVVENAVTIDRKIRLYRDVYCLLPKQILAKVGPRVYRLVSTMFAGGS